MVQEMWVEKEDFGIDVSEFIKTELTTYAASRTNLGEAALEERIEFLEEPNQNSARYSFLGPGD